MNRPILEPIYHASLRRALLQRGIFGRPAARLLEEIQDHFVAATEDFQAQGSFSVEAQKQAMKTLGEPSTIATSAWENLRQEKWITRHPMLFGVALVPAAMVVGAVLPVAFALFSVNDPLEAQLARPWVQLIAETMNWLPLLMIGGLAVAFCRRYALGWKTLYAAFLGITLGFSLLGVWTSHDYAQATLTLEYSPLGMLWCTWIHYATNWPIFLNVASSTGQLFYFHLLLPIALLMGIQFFVSRSPDPRVES